jgi:hypothetical protein
MSLVVVAPLSGSAANAETTARVAPLTRLTIRTPGCNGCEIRLFQAVVGRKGVWQSRTRQTTDGKVTFTIPTARTHGLSMSVRAPWESSNGIPTGYVTMTAFRYRGHKPGSSVDFRTARTQKRASGCWAGTDQRAKTLTLGVRRVRVHGTTGMTDGTIVWMPVQARSWAPMQQVVGGIFGAQDAVFCKRP